MCEFVQYSTQQHNCAMCKMFKFGFDCNLGHSDARSHGRFSAGAALDGSRQAGCLFVALFERIVYVFSKSGLICFGEHH